MTLKSRLEKLERSAVTLHVEGIRRPAEVTEAIWQRAMELLADYSPEMLHRWKSVEDLVESCRQRQPMEWEYFPTPILDVVDRATVEAETGELPPDLMTRLRNDLAHLAETPEAELVEFLRGLDMGIHDDYCLPPPYSVSVLEQVGNTAATICGELADKLRGGEISEAEYAAKLAQLLPPVTRADQENAMRRLLEMCLEPVELPQRPR